MSSSPLASSEDSSVVRRNKKVRLDLDDVVVLKSEMDGKDDDEAGKIYGPIIFGSYSSFSH
jgi:hypothetical protein